MFWGMILRSPPVLHIKGVFIEPPHPVEIVRSFHVSKAILFNPRDYYADGAYGFVRVMVHNPRHSIEICRMYNNRSGMTQADLNLTFSKRDVIAFFTSIHGSLDTDSPYGPNYVPEIHLSGFFLDAYSEDVRQGTSHATHSASQLPRRSVHYSMAEKVIQGHTPSVAVEVVRPPESSTETPQEPEESSEK